MAVSLATADLRSVTGTTKAWLVGACAMLALLTAVVAMQSTVGLPLPPAAIWAQAAGVLGEPLPARSSATAAQPWLALGTAILVTLTFMRALLRPGGWWAGLLRRTVGSMVVAVALFSMLAFLAAPDWCFGGPRKFHRNSLTGTFMNRNTAASLFGVGLLIWTLRTCADWRLTLAGHQPTPVATPPVAASAAMLCLVALAANRIAGREPARPRRNSRCGAALRRPRPPAACPHAACTHRSRWGHRRAGDLERSGCHTPVPDRLDRSAAPLGLPPTLALALDHPWLGIGLGNFEIVFPSVRPADIGSAGIWTKAHNTPLEILVEIGFPAALTLFAFFGIMLAVLARRAVRERSRPAIIAFAAAAFAVLHGLVDFSLQIPGMAVVFAALVGAGLAPRLKRSQR